MPLTSATFVLGFFSLVIYFLWGLGFLTPSVFLIIEAGMTLIYVANALLENVHAISNRIVFYLSLLIGFGVVRLFIWKQWVSASHAMGGYYLFGIIAIGIYMAIYFFKRK